MTLKELSSKWAHLKVCEQRSDREEYIELVFSADDSGQWTDMLAAALGPAEKEAGAGPTEEQLSLTRPFGGIYEDQILFRQDFPGHSVLAMLWPWQDGMHTTLKLALIKPGKE